jgi:hypothetical protein
MSIKHLDNEELDRLLAVALAEAKQLVRYTALPASTSSAEPEAIEPIITPATISHFAAGFCMADSDLPLPPSRSTVT